MHCSTQALTGKQAAFAMAVCSGLSLSDAYRRSYAAGTMKPATVHREAHALARNPKVATSIEALRARIEAISVETLRRDRELVLATLRDVMNGVSSGRAAEARVRAAAQVGTALNLF